MTLAELADQLEQALAAARADHATSQAGRDGIPFELMRDTTGRYIAVDGLTTLLIVRAALEGIQGPIGRTPPAGESGVSKSPDGRR